MDDPPHMTSPQLLLIACHNPRQLHGLLKTIADLSGDDGVIHRIGSFAVLRLTPSTRAEDILHLARLRGVEVLVWHWREDGQECPGRPVLIGTDHDGVLAVRSVLHRWRRHQARRAARVTAGLVDRILDRISRVGLAGLWPVERRLLDRYAAEQHQPPAPPCAN